MSNRRVSVVLFRPDSAARVAAYPLLLVLISLIALPELVAAQAPEVSQIYPEAAPRTDTVTVRVYGANFQTDPVSAVKLIRPGCPDVNAFSINISSEEYFTCSLDVSRSPIGLYGFVTSNGSGVDTLPGCFLVYAPTDSPYVWTETTVISGGSPFFGLAVGDADCDNNPELYGGSGNIMFRFKWNGTSWDTTWVDCGFPMIFHMFIADGNGDDTPELYFACFDDSIYQLKRDGMTWNRTFVGSTKMEIRGFASGDGDRDGKCELYASDMESLYQFEWTGVYWDRYTVGVCSLPPAMLSGVLAVGDGNNDGQMEVYSGLDEVVYQFKHGDSGWERTIVDTSGFVGSMIAVGDGDWDDSMELYGINDTVCEYHWDGAQWCHTGIGSAGGFRAAVGDGNGDGLRDVYTDAVPGMGYPPLPGLFEFHWNGVRWSRTWISTVYPLYDIVIGDGDADGRMEVCSADDGRLLQFRTSRLPDITLSDSSHDFDSVAVGDSSDWEYLVIGNIGLDTLVVDSILTDAADYAVMDLVCPKTIHVGDSALVTVRFRPSALGAIPGNIVVFSSDPSSPLLIVSLAGAGTDETPPTPFRLVSPPDSSGIALTKPAFVWESSKDTLTGLREYELYLNSSPDDTTSDTILTLGYELPEGWHHWYVVAYDSAGNSRVSDNAWWFVVDTTSPSPASPLSPPDGSYLNDTIVTVIWHQPFDSVSGIHHYVLEFATDSTFASGNIETTSTDTSFTTVFSDSTYHWRVKGIDSAHNEGEWSAVWSFTLDTSVPGVPTLLSPSSGMVLSDTVVFFEWTEVTGMNSKTQKENTPPSLSFTQMSYALEIDTLPDFCSLVFQDTLETTSVSVSLFEHLPLYWRVKAQDQAHNPGAFSDPDSFGIDTTAPVVESTSVVSDTSFMGPFEILTEATDKLAGVDSVVLYYMRDEDADWVSTTMNLLAPTWYIDTIPAVSNQNDTVRYYIGAFDAAQPANVQTDPAGGAADAYSFVANVVGIEEARELSGGFSFEVPRTPSRSQVVFKVRTPAAGFIGFRIYDVAGRLVDEPLQGERPAGFFDVAWGTGFPTGIYFVTIHSDFGRRIGKVVLIR